MSLARFHALVPTAVPPFFYTLRMEFILASYRRGALRILIENDRHLSLSFPPSLNLSPYSLAAFLTGEDSRMLKAFNWGIPVLPPKLALDPT